MKNSFIAAAVAMAAMVLENEGFMSDKPGALDHQEGDKPGALDHQEGGQHYKDLPIQPVQFILANEIGFVEGNVIKYVTRWRLKNGVEDLKKARHFLDILIEHEERAK